MRRSRSLIAPLLGLQPSATRPPARRISLIRAAPQPRRFGQLRASSTALRQLSDAPRFANGAPLADSNKMGAAASCVGSKEDPITSGDVEVAQEAWAKGIVDIGKVYQDKGD